MGCVLPYNTFITHKHIMEAKVTKTLTLVLSESDCEELKILLAEFDGLWDRSDGEMRTFKQLKLECSMRNKTFKVVKAIILIIAMFLLIIPEPSTLTMWISGFLFGIFLQYKYLQ